MHSRLGSNYDENNNFYFIPANTRRVTAGPIHDRHTSERNGICFGDDFGYIRYSEY